MARLIIVLSGCRGAGKNTFANMLAVQWLRASKEIGFTENPLVDVRLENDAIAYSENFGTAGATLPCDGVSLESGVGAEPQIQRFGFRIHAFATLLKMFLQNTMGINQRYLFGSTTEKLHLTHLRWHHLPLGIRWRNRINSFSFPRHGYMTAREVMQVFGTDMMRRWDDNVWVRSAMQYAVNSPQKVVVLADGRFPNEVDYAIYCRELVECRGSMGQRRALLDQHKLFNELIDSDVVIKTVRLRRRTTDDQHKSEIAMDDYPLERFDVVADPDIDLEGMEKLASKYAGQWFREAHLI